MKKSRNKSSYRKSAAIEKNIFFSRKPYRLFQKKISLNKKCIFIIGNYYCRQLLESLSQNFVFPSLKDPFV